MGVWLHSGLDAFRKQGQFYDGFYFNFRWMAISKMKAYNGKEPAVTPISWEGWVCISVVHTVMFSIFFEEIMN